MFRKSRDSAPTAGKTPAHAPRNTPSHPPPAPPKPARHAAKPASRAPAQVQATGPVLLHEHRDGITLLALNRPETRNSLSEAMLSALGEAFVAIAQDTKVRAVVIAANGPVAVRAILRTMRETEGLAENDAFAIEAKIGAAVFASDDAREGPRAFAEKRRPRFRDALLTYSAGVFVCNVTPARTIGGDATRAALIKPKVDAPGKLVAASVVYDRATDAIGVLVLAALALPVLWHSSSAPFIVTVLALAALGLAVPQIRKLVRGRIAKWHEALVGEEQAAQQQSSR